MWRAARGEDGAVAVEFAIVLPVFLTVVFGIIGFGLYLSAAMAVEAAVHAGARASVAGLDDTARQQLAAEAVEAALDAYGGIVSFEDASVTYPAASLTDHFQVRIEYSFPLAGAMPFIPDLSKITREAVAPHGGF